MRCFDFTILTPRPIDPAAIYRIGHPTYADTYERISDTIEEGRMHFSVGTKAQ